MTIKQLSDVTATVGALETIDAACLRLDVVLVMRTDRLFGQTVRTALLESKDHQRSYSKAHVADTQAGALVGLAGEIEASMNGGMK